MLTKSKFWHNDVIVYYWQQKSDVWPQMARAVHGLLGGPATSTSPKKSSLLAGCTLEKRHSQLSGLSVWTAVSTWTVTMDWTVVMFLHSAGSQFTVVLYTSL